MKTAKAKLQKGNRRKVLWQYRNNDIKEFEFIRAIHDLENSVLKIVKSHISGLHDKRAGSKEYERGYARALSDLEDLVNQELNDINDE